MELHGIINRFPSQEGKVAVYTSALPSEEVGEALFPPQRNAEITLCTNERLKRQKYYVWKLLFYGLERFLNKKPTELHFWRNEQGKWGCEECFFSLSHSENGLAVAISKESVGVDIQRIRSVADSLKERILPREELEKWQSLSEKEGGEFFITAWTKKESLFKAFSLPVLKKSEKDVGRYALKTVKLVLCDGEYILSAVGKEGMEIEIYEDIRLT